MDYKMTEFGQDILADVTEFCRRELAERLRATDHSGEWPQDAYDAAAEMGIGSAFVTEEYEGGGLSLMDQAAILEELGACDAGFAVSYMANRLAQAAVEIAGTEEQKKMLYGILNEGGFAAFCLTEDQAGSDLAGCRTRATKRDGGYVLDGSKLFVTNGPLAEAFVVFAVTDEEGTKNNLSAFLVPGDAPGITRGTEEKKLGIRNSGTCEISFQKVEVSVDNRLGAPGEGLAIALKTLDQARIWCGVTAVGVARHGLDVSVARVKEREQFGKPLAENEVVLFKLADMEMKIFAARQCCIAALEKLAMGEDVTMEGATAKCLAADAAVDCALEAVQLFGGYGYCEEFPAEKLLRDAKIFQIFEGTNEIQRLVVGRGVVKRY